MGRRRKGRKIEKRVKPKLPEVFDCPNCGHKSIYIKINRKEGTAYVSCGYCKISYITRINPLTEAVDVYGEFLDKYYAGEIEEKEISSEEKKEEPL